MSAADRREAILDAALDAFADSGFHETSLDDVAGGRDLEGADLRAFRPGQDLFDALLETYVGELMERVMTSVATANDAEEIPGRPRRFPFLRRGAAWRLEAAHPPFGRRRYHRHLRAPFRRDRRRIWGAMAQEVPATASPEGIEFDMAVAAIARQLLGSIRAIADWWDENREITREQILVMVMEFSWVGMQRVAAGETWTPAAD